VNKEIVHASGLVLPSGQHLAKGTWLGAASLDIHLDDRFYPDAKEYKPFRFVSGEHIDEEVTDATLPEQQDRLDSNAPFLSFGAGRHRWWVVSLSSYSAFAIPANAFQ
jgi:cytochrome P450